MNPDDLRRLLDYHYWARDRMLEAVDRLPPDQFTRNMGNSFRSIRDTIATAIAVNLSMVSVQENETMKRLAAYGALVAVPTMIAGIYGMNFEHMPELGWKYGYWTVVGIMVAIDGYLFYRLRKAKWL